MKKDENTRKVEQFCFKAAPERRQARNSSSAQKGVTGACSSHRKRSVAECSPTGRQDDQSWLGGRPKMT